MDDEKFRKGIFEMRNCTIFRRQADVLLRKILLLRRGDTFDRCVCQFLTKKNLDEIPNFWRDSIDTACRPRKIFFRWRSDIFNETSTIFDEEEYQQNSTFFVKLCAIVLEAGIFSFENNIALEIAILWQRLTEKRGFRIVFPIARTEVSVKPFNPTSTRNVITQKLNIPPRVREESQTIAMAKRQGE